MPDLLDDLQFFDGYLYPFSELLEMVLFRLESAEILKVVNPSYKQYVISDETKSDLKARVLPRFDAKKRERHEIAILDLPLLQRLRKISQVDLVPLVFPSGNHNRFEHTLGVTVVAENLAQALGRRRAKLMSRRDILHLRLAAILHDVGHGPFSHIESGLQNAFFVRYSSRASRKASLAASRIQCSAGGSLA